MDKNSEEYESIKSKIMKLKALAEKGEPGERDNAARLLRRYCATVGINLSDIEDNEKEQMVEFKVGRDDTMFTLFSQCFFRITGETTMNYRRFNSICYVNMTSLQAAELGDLWNWHKAHFKKEFARMKKEFVTAYVVKHHLSSGKHTDSNEPLTKEDLEELRREFMMMATMSDDVYLKALCNKVKDSK